MEKQSLEGTELQLWLKRLEVFLTLQRGLSVHTCAAYGTDLTACAAFLQTRGLQNWSTVCREDLSSWVHHLSDLGHAPRTLARKLSALRTFFRFLKSQGLRADDPAALLEHPRPCRPLPSTLPYQHTAHLLAQPEVSTALGIRDQAILELLYGSGLRVSELCGLNLTQLNLEESWVRLWGKGSKERMVPLGQEAKKALTLYLAEGRPYFIKPCSGGNVFLSRTGKMISRKTVWHLVRRYGLKAGLNTSAKPHLLRHCFATDLLAGGANLRAIQEMLGHSHISTTQIYTAVEKSQLLDAHAQFHPSWDSGLEPTAPVLTKAEKEIHLGL